MNKGMELNGDFFVENIDFLQEIVVELSEKNKDILEKIFIAVEKFVPKVKEEVTYWSLYSKYRYSQEEGYRKDYIEWGEVILEKSQSPKTKETFLNITFIPALGNTYTVGNYSRKMELLPPPIYDCDTSSKVYSEKLMENILNSLLYQIQQFIKNVDLYNQWIKDELPHYFRKGKILHKEFNKVCSKFNFSSYQNPILDRIKRSEITYFPEMTLGIYGSLWGVAHQSLVQEKHHQVSPIESFYNANFKYTNHEMTSNCYNYNKWNDQAMFQDWLQEGSHQCDLIYSRLSLVPIKGASGWRIKLFHHEPWFGDIFKIYKAITDVFDVGLDIEKNMYCDLLEGVDYIKLVERDRTYYHPEEKVYIGISLYSLEESERSQVIKLAEWDNIDDYYLKLI